MTLLFSLLQKVLILPGKGNKTSSRKNKLHFIISVFPFTFAALNAQVAKLVDALCSGRSVRKDVLVRIQSWALHKSGSF